MGERLRGQVYNDLPPLFSSSKACPPPQTADREADEYAQQQRDLGYAMPSPDVEKVLMLTILTEGNFDVSSIVRYFQHALLTNDSASTAPWPSLRDLQRSSKQIGPC